MENMNSGEKSDQFGTWGPKEHGNELPEFSFSSYTPDLELKSR